MSRLPARLLYVFLATLALASISGSADSTIQLLPFNQDWSDTAAISTDDNWNGVAGIVGHRGDGMTSATAVNPQTVLLEGTNVVDVIANQSNPDAVVTGGVAEFHLPDPVVALQGSGTARAPHLLINVSTIGRSAVTVAYTLRDIDGSADNAVQPIALQFRIGSTGNFTNVPAAFVADATTGGAATLVTPVSVTLPDAVNDQPHVQLRIITTDAVGSDEWVGIDDLAIGATTGPSLAANGSASPSTVLVGAQTILTVTVTPGSNPPSTGVIVTGDLSAIGGSASQPFADMGTNVFTHTALVTGPAGTAAIPVTVTDDQGRTALASIALTINEPRPPAAVVISQVYGGGGNSGATYKNDFVELFNRGPETVDLTGWAIGYASASGITWQTTPLSGTIAPGRYFLVQQAAGSGGSASLPAPDATGSIPMSATAGKVALTSSAAVLAGACAVGPAVVDAVGYGSANCFEGSAPAAPPSNSTAALRKRGGCFDSDENGFDFLIGSPIPRNGASAARSCEYLTRAIHEIQGDGIQTPLIGQDVTTTGIVTGRKINGFFMQTADAGTDANPATSQGIFVFTSALPAVAAGDAVTVKGTAAEFFNLTQLESTLPGDITVDGSGHALPVPVPLTPALLDPTGTPAQLERVEGMRLSADTLVSAGPTNSFGEVATVLGGVARPMREPGIEISLPVPPDPVTGVVDCCIARWDENPERITIDSDGLAGTAPVWVTSHVTFTNVIGPLDFTFGAYKLLPELLVPATSNIVATAAPAPAANEFTVAGYNIENFASSNTTQLRKASLAIRTLMRYPDIVGVVEIADLASLEALAARVSLDAGAAGDPDPAYVARLVPASPTATQNVGFLVKSSRVETDGVGQEGAGATYINPLTGSPETLHDRPPLVLRATVNPGDPHGGSVIVVVNHLRSFIDIELVGGEGVRVRAKRKAQAEAVAALLQQLQADNPGTPVIAVGDYNAFQFSDGYTDPIATLVGAPRPGDQLVVDTSPDLVDPNYVNLIERLPAEQQYTFNFEGTPQALDHVLVNTVADGLFQRIAVARSNADFPGDAAAGLSGNASRPEANSDHDMPVAYFAFPGTPVVTLQGAAEMTVEAYTSFVDPGATAHDDRGSLPVTVTGAVDVNVPGDYSISYTATNGFQTTTVSRTVHVVDSTPPAITGFTATPSSLGPPNHRMVNVSLIYDATDGSGTAACAASVASNEPANGPGDGNTAADWLIVSATHVLLRAERAGGGDDRIYTLTVTCADNAGNRSAATATVSVQK